jgi:hypothetical protein
MGSARERWALGVRGVRAARLVGAAALAACVLAPAVAAARTPLPTIEVVQPPRRLRLLDVRGPVQFGWGWSNVYRAPVYAMSFEAQISMLELTDTTWMHVVFGESGVLSAVRPAGEERPPGFLGIDVGLGLSRYAPRGPAFLLTVTTGPRWAHDGPQRLRSDGIGVQGKAEVYPFYMSVPEIVASDRGWFRRRILSGLSLWASARWDQVLDRRGNTWAGGVGLDLGRTVLLPVIQAVDGQHRS